MAKVKTPIKVETLPNGYSLNVYDNQYLYFNETQLFEGLCYHAGMAIMKEADKKVIREIIANLLAGDTEALMKRNQEQQAEIAKLTSKIRTLQAEKAKMVAKIKKQDKKQVYYD